jgi:hypothetical protein
MAKSNPTRPNAPQDEVELRDDESLPPTSGPPLKDPRSQAAIDGIGVDTPGDLLDTELDDQPGDRDASGNSFADDVRSDAPRGGREDGEPR